MKSSIKIRTFFAIACAILIGTACSKSNDASKEDTPANTPGPEASPASIYDDYLNRDVRDDVFYFVMPDRFNNANPDNDNGSKEIAISSGGLDRSSKWAFHGGDMQGIEEKLDYLKDMGITAIWMTPILRNKAVQKDGFAHHGYWIVDFTEIDSHFGTNDDLKSLINAAHAKGIKIFFDIITNHTADVIKYRECHDETGKFKEGLDRCEYKSLAQIAAGDTYTPFVPEKEQGQKFPEWLNDPQYYHNQGDTTFEGENSLYGDFFGLDDINTEHPRVVEGMIEIYQNIISEFKPDGFRIDTVRHVQLPFWQEFGPAIMDHAKKEGIPNFHIFGEVYDPSPASLSRFTTIGKLPAVLDFGFQDAAAKIFYQDQNPEVMKTLIDNDDYYNDADSQADLLLTFLGNHDMGRTGYFINQGVVDASSEEKLQRSILSHALMYMTRGIPVVYYGDEQGFTGDGNDVDARENMFASQVASYNDNILLGSTQTTAEDNFNSEHPIYRALKEFAQLRFDHPTLRRGIQINRFFDTHTKAFAFSRVDIEERTEYLVVFNSDTQTQSVELKASADTYKNIYGDADINIESGNVKVELAGLSFAVFKAEQALAASSTDIQLKKVETGKDAEHLWHVQYSIESALPIALRKVTTEYLDENGEWQVAAHDYTEPYSAYIEKTKFTHEEQRKLRVTVDNLAGDKKTSLIALP